MQDSRQGPSFRSNAGLISLARPDLGRIACARTTVLLTGFGANQRKRVWFCQSTSARRRPVDVSRPRPETLGRCAAQAPSPESRTRLDAKR